MNTETILVIFRLLVACVFAVGAVYLASIGANGWGWCIFASIVLGSLTYDTDDTEKTED